MVVLVEPSFFAMQAAYWRLSLLPVDHDGGAIKVGWCSAMDTKDFVAFFVLALVVDSGLPRAVAGKEFGFAVVFAVAVFDGDNSLSFLGSDSRASRLESQCSSRGAAR